MPAHTMATHSRTLLSNVSKLDAVIENINTDFKDVTEKWNAFSRKPELIVIFQD